MFFWEVCPQNVTSPVSFPSFYCMQDIHFLLDFIYYIYYTILYCATLILHYTVLHCTILSLILYYTTMFYIMVLLCTILIFLYYTVLYCTVLYYTVWYYTVLWKVKCTLVQALGHCTDRTAHRGGRGIALLYRHWGSVQAVRPIGGVEV
jgi:hypothetical protein